MYGGRDMHHADAILVLRHVVPRAFLHSPAREPDWLDRKELEMMNHYPHHPTHWLGVALVLGLGLLALEAAGQQTVNELHITANAGAVFQGRPAMAGAQAGLGAMAGPPQGGIGLQGSDGAGLNLRKPRVIEEQTNPLPPVACADVPRISSAEQPLCLPQVRDERFERRLAILGIDAQQRGRM